MIVGVAAVPCDAMQPDERGHDGLQAAALRSLAVMDVFDR